MNVTFLWKEEKEKSKRHRIFKSNFSSVQDFGQETTITMNTFSVICVFLVGMTQGAPATTPTSLLPFTEEFIKYKRLAVSETAGLEAEDTTEGRLRRAVSESSVEATSVGRYMRSVSESIEATTPSEGRYKRSDESTVEATSEGSLRPRRAVTEKASIEATNPTGDRFRREAATTEKTVIPTEDTQFSG